MASVVAVWFGRYTMQRREEAVRAWREGGGGKRTLNDLYDEIRRRWKAVTTKPFPWRRDSERMMFGKWRKGMGQQFAADEPMRKVLVEVLGVEDASLFPPEVKGDGVHPMRGFEALGAIDPRIEKPCQAATLVRVSGPGRDRYHRSPDRPVESLLSTKLRRGRHWVVAPIGAGRTLTALSCEGHAAAPSAVAEFFKDLGGPQLQQGVPRQVLSLATLDGLRATAPLRPEVPLVVKVERPGEKDVATAEILARTDDVLVLATFAPPRERDETDDSYTSRWEEWTVWKWRPDHAWRREFVAWIAERIAQRLPHSELVAADVVAWLDRSDPKLERYGTPADLLPILELAHQHGAPNLPEHLDLDFVRRHLARAQDRAAFDARGHWLRTQGASTMIELMRAAWRDPRVQWPARLTETEAAALIPPSTLPSIDDRHIEVKRLVTSLTRARTEKKQADTHRQIDQLLDAVDRPGEAVSVLVDAALLHPVGGGRFSLGAHWVQEAAISRCSDIDSRWGHHSCRLECSIS